MNFVSKKTYNCSIPTSLLTRDTKYGWKYLETLCTVKFGTSSIKMSHNTTSLYPQLWWIMYNVHKWLGALNVNSMHTCWKSFPYWRRWQRRQRRRQQQKILTDAKFHAHVKTATPAWFPQHKIVFFSGCRLPPQPGGPSGPLHSYIPIQKRDGPVNKYHSQYTTHTFK